MGIVIYVETNFLMSVAMGREPRGDDLLAAVSATTRVMIPSACYMESFSAFEDEQRLRKRFGAELDKQISQLRRYSTSASAGTLLRSLEESRIANDHLLNDVQARLYQLVERAADVFDRIPETAEVLRAAVGNVLIAEPTDNLIVHTIIDHASRIPGATKVLLTDNTKDFGTSEVQTALGAVGINKPFRSVTNLLGWLGSLSE